MQTPEQQKAQLFALYWGQKVLYIGGHGLVELGHGGWNLKHPDFFLYLTPLHMITDEDAIAIGIIDLGSEYDNKVTYEEVLKYSKRDILNAYRLHSDVSDYLRSRGYAIPWNGISVEQQISNGWIKLKTV